MQIHLLGMYERPEEEARFIPRKKLRQAQERSGVSVNASRMATAFSVGVSD